MHHCRHRNARKRAVRKQSAETDRQKKKRLKTLHDGEIHENETHGNHNELTNTVRHVEKSGHFMSLDEAAVVGEVAADPLAVLVPVTVAVSTDIVTGAGLREIGHLRTVSGIKVSGDVGRGFLLHESHDSGIAGKILHLSERLLPSRLISLREKRTAKGKHHDN